MAELHDCFIPYFTAWMLYLIGILFELFVFFWVLYSMDNLNSIQLLIRLSVDLINVNPAFWTRGCSVGSAALSSNKKMTHAATVKYALVRQAGIKVP